MINSDKKVNSLTVVVLGMHRSGSSATAHVIEELGINMGEIMVSAGVGNKWGHFEDKDFYDLNKRIINTGGGKWYDPPTRFKILTKAQEEIPRAKALIDRKNRRDVWGFKDPRTSITLSLYKHLLRNPYYIICDRSDEAIADSLKRRDKGKYNSYQKNVILSREYYLRIEGELDFSSDHILRVQHDELMQDTKHTVKKIAKFLPISVSKEQTNNAVKTIRK